MPMAMIMTDQHIRALAPYRLIVYQFSLGFKRLPNAKAVVAVHFDLAEVHRDAHGDQYESEAYESDGGLQIYGFHRVFFLPLNSLSSAISAISPSIPIFLGFRSVLDSSLSSNGAT